MKKNKGLKIFVVTFFLFILSGCSIFFNDDYEYYDSNIKYIEEQNRIKTEEKQQKIETRNYIDELMNPYFKNLNFEEKQIYYDILEGTNKPNDTLIELVYPISEKRFKVVFNSFLYDNPEIFWIKNYAFTYSFDDENSIDKIWLKFYQDITNLDEMKQKFNQAIDEIIYEANKFDTIIEKEKYVHDILVNKITYDKEMSDNRAYNALIYNRTVCSGYAKAFQVVMKKLGIPTYYIIGDVIKEEENSLHAWNLIRIDDEYYNVDVTWDDAIDRYGNNKLVYTYFNVSDDTIGKNHIRSELSLNLPPATGNKYSNIYK